MLTAMIASAEIDPTARSSSTARSATSASSSPTAGSTGRSAARGTSRILSRSLWDRTLEVQRPAGLGRAASTTIRTSSRTSRCAWSNGPITHARQRLSTGSSPSPSARAELDEQIAAIRSILVWSFAVLGIGLFVMAMLQTWYGLGPLRRVRRAIARIRTTGANRVTDPLPQEVQPMVEELNALLAHSETQAEEARTHAGNLAHALKTPLTVLTNAASAHAPDLDETVLREAATMRRQVDHHLARARAVGRRATGPCAHQRAARRSKACVRAVTRLHPQVRFDIDGTPRRAGGDRAAGPRRDPRQPDRERRQVRRRQRVRHRRSRSRGASCARSGSRTTASASPKPTAPSCSLAARGSTPRSPAPASASRSCATWSRSTAARSSWARARTWAGCWSRCGCRGRGKRFSSGSRYRRAEGGRSPCRVPRSRVGRGGRLPSR